MARVNPFLLLLVFSVACGASRAGTETSVTPVTTQLISSGGSLTVTGAASYTAIATSIPVRPDSAFKLLQAAYAKLEIPIAQVDPKARSIGNEGLKIRRRVGGLTMQSVLECGEKMGLPNAETWDIFLNILSFVAADGPEGSSISTRIQATGHDPSVSGREQTSCGTKGELEAKIGNTVKLLSLKK
jgi:hypothetical protein